MVAARLGTHCGPPMRSLRCGGSGALQTGSAALPVPRGGGRDASHEVNVGRGPRCTPWAGPAKNDSPSPGVGRTIRPLGGAGEPARSALTNQKQDGGAFVMAEKTMSEKDMLMGAFEREYQTTLKFLKAYPEAKCELKPAEKLKSARELAWMLVLNQMVMIPTMKADLKPGSLPPAPKTWDEVLVGLEREHRESVNKLNALTDEQMNRTLKLPVGPGQIADVRIGDALWMFLNDTIHHRGQLTVYARIAGGKLPSIYGPTADEPWF